MKKIAIEEHFSTPRMARDQRIWEDRLGMAGVMGNKFVAERVSLIGLPFDVDRLPSMDANEVQMQIISCNWPASEGYEDPAVAVEAAREFNDAAVEKMSVAPERFRAFAALPWQSPSEAVRELVRCVKQLGFVGAMVQGTSALHYLDEPQFDEVWAALEDLDVPLYLHVGHPLRSSLASYGPYTEMFGPCWNWASEGTTHVLRMVFGGVFERHPNAKLILGHLGETIPYLLRRIDEGAEKTGVFEKNRITRLPSFYLKRNLYVSTSGEYQPEVLRCAIEAMGIDHVLFANDYPLCKIKPGVDCLEACALSEEEKKAIYHENAERIFKLSI